MIFGKFRSSDRYVYVHSTEHLVKNAYGRIKEAQVLFCGSELKNYIILSPLLFLEKEGGGPHLPHFACLYGSRTCAKN